MIRAIFIGADGSLGFRTGQEYPIRTTISNNQIVVFTRTRSCPYSSLEAFLRNWEIKEMMHN